MVARAELGWSLLRSPAHRWALLSRAQLRILENLPPVARKGLFKGSAYHCPLCETELARFLRWGSSRNSLCPVCGSMQRHRLAWLVLQRRTDLLDGEPKRVLHIAPEPSLAARLLRQPGIDYLSADHEPLRAMRQLDITNLDLPSASFDVVLCNHVLEHVLDPPRAASEFHRVLKPGGWAAIAVPVRDTPTIGDPTCGDPAERQRRFGQHDHYWFFGPDIVDLLAAPGFAVETYRTPDITTVEERQRFSLLPREPLFICRKAP